MKPRIRTSSPRAVVLAIAAGVTLLALPGVPNAAVTPNVNGTVLTLTGDAAADNITLGVDAAGDHPQLRHGRNGLASATDFDPGPHDDAAATARSP